MLRLKLVVLPPTGWDDPNAKEHVLLEGDARASTTFGEIQDAEDLLNKLFPNRPLAIVVDHQP